MLGSGFTRMSVFEGRFSRGRWGVYEAQRIASKAAPHLIYRNSPWSGDEAQYFDRDTADVHTNYQWVWFNAPESEVRPVHVQ